MSINSYILLVSVEKYIKHLNKNGVRMFRSTEIRQMIPLMGMVTVTQRTPRVQ